MLHIRSDGNAARDDIGEEEAVIFISCWFAGFRFKSNCYCK